MQVDAGCLDVPEGFRPGRGRVPLVAVEASVLVCCLVVAGLRGLELFLSSGDMAGVVPDGDGCDLLLADRARLPGLQAGAQRAGFVSEPGSVQVRAGCRERVVGSGGRAGGGGQRLSGLLPVVPGGQVSSQRVVHDRSGPPAGGERGFRGRGPQGGLSSAVGLFGGVRLSGRARLGVCGGR